MEHKLLEEFKTAVKNIAIDLSINREIKVSQDYNRGEMRYSAVGGNTKYYFEVYAIKREPNKEIEIEIGISDSSPPE